MVSITGAVGSGKSTFLLALCGELRVLQGNLLFGSEESTMKGVAYCSQEPWLQQGTVRENITFGSDFVDSWYQRVVEACALSTDFEVIYRIIVLVKWKAD